jgi:hypothetical protein
MINPFKIWTTSYQDFEIMSDLKRHCTKCALKSWQAKTWQVRRQEKWIQLDTDEHGNYYKTMQCNKCGQNTVHRKLQSIEILEETKTRSWLPSPIVKRIKDLYHNEEAIFLRELSDRELEVDHKFPQIRRDKNEKNNTNLTDTELKKKFILLSRSNNLLKSRQCEKCFQTGKRWSCPWIKFRYKGNEERDKSINKYDEKWCEWCFRYDPYERRKRLDKKISWY